MALYGRGSEWRRWDLHVHTPGTALEDNFGTWDDYVAAVEAAGHDVVALGMTDYVTIDSYKKFLEYRAKGRMSSIALALPNIEFRITPETAEGKGINIHLLVSPDDPEHVARIEESLSRLFLKRAKENIPCTEQGLIRLGKIIKPDLQSDRAAFVEGVRQFKVDFDHLREWYESEEWLRRNSLIALAAKSTDGASGLRDSGFLATRRELYAFAHIIFSGNPKERESWLGRGGIPEGEFQALGVPKPVVHGSDAHNIARLFRPDLDRFCWIKADPTFEGLRQILYEPEDRVWIGEVPPSTHGNRSVLDCLSISNANGWFDERSIPLNAGLVAIVGLKGSGKTAIADLIAFAAGAGLDEHNSFVSRASDHIEGLSVSLRWKDGSEDPAKIPFECGGASGLGVKYLTQRFVERLCAGDSLSEDLQREVESVIFEHIPTEDRLTAEDFAELRALRTEGLREGRVNLQNIIAKCGYEIAELTRRRAEILKKNRRRAELPKLLETAKKSIPKVDDEANVRKLEELRKLKEQKTKLSNTIAELKGNQQKIVDVGRRLTAKFAEFAAFWEECEKMLKNLRFPDAAITKLRPVVPFDRATGQLSSLAATIFKSRQAEVAAEIKEKESAPASASAIATSSMAALDSEIKKLEEHLKLDETKKRQILESQRQESALLEEQRKIELEFAWVDKEYKQEREQIHGRRVESYLSYFKLLDEEREILEGLYSPLKTALSSLGVHEQRLNVVCRVDVNSAAWLSRGQELFDLRKVGSFRFDEIQAIVQGELGKAWRSCNRSQVSAGLEKCFGLIKDAEDLPSQLKSGYQPLDVANWLFSVDHIAITHGIQYEGKDLRLLSPGSKGIVLLILYLAVDRSDTRPLIVDQPDENLDNQSTYEILRTYFREAKKRRQIIIITHNPNLVVNTDAEQIIVARSDLQSNGLPYLRYSAGSLEALKADGPLEGSIREEFCRILEGGREAFRKRLQRYGKSLST